MPAETPLAVADSPLLLTGPEAADRLRISERTLYTLREQGEVPAVRIGSRVLYDPRDLAGFIAKRKTTAAAAPEVDPAQGGVR